MTRDWGRLGRIRRSVFFVFALLLIGCSQSDEQRAPKKAEAAVVLPETVELALLVAALTPLGLDTGTSIDRTSAYFRDVEAHFGGFRAHPAVEALGSDFSLPRLAGNAADYAFDESGNLVRVDSSGALWQDAEGDLFTRNASALADFAQVTQFRSFYSAHRPLYAGLIRDLEDAAGPGAQRTWLEANFSARPRPSQVIVSPLLSGHHWTTLFKPTPRIWLSPPRPEELTSQEARLGYARKLFTEVSHQYVNPLTDSLGEAAAHAMADPAVWRHPDAGGYDSSVLRFNEYMTWAAFLLFASDHFDAPSAEPFEALLGDISDFMVTRRGFVAFEPFAREALRKYREGASGEEVQRAMVAWATEYSSGAATAK